MALAAFAVAGAASAADLSGTWAVKGDIAGNAVEPTCTFKQAGAALTGKCGAGDNAGDISNGAVSGKDVSWSWEAGGFTLAFKGTADSDTSIKGSIDVGGGTGTFTAAKQ
jgi:hypothetical protein